MIRIKWVQGTSYMIAWDRVILCSCEVKTLAGGTRPKWMIVRTMPGDLPYDPREFPKGTWEVGAPRVRTDPYKRPYFIPTNAWQGVEVWGVEDRAYTKPTGETDVDTGYGIHFSESRTTLGCVKVESERDLVWIVDKVEKALREGEVVEMEVT